MALAWNPVGFLGILALVFTWGMGALVLFSAPTRAQNRRLALVLLVEGAGAVTGGGLLYLTEDLDVAYALQTVAMVCQFLLPPLYLHFLASLETPLVRPFQTRPGRGALLALALGSLFVYAWQPRNFVAGMSPRWYATWEAVPGQWWFGPVLLMLLVSLFGLAVAVSAYRRAPAGTARRKRAKAFAVAFGARDALLALALLLPLFVAPYFPSRLWDLRDAIAVTLVFVVYVPLIGYAILRHQLFDIDLKIKWTLERGTVAAIFLGIYVVVSQAASSFLVPRVGAFLGALAVAGLVFAIMPLQRLAERFSRVVLPGVDASPAYLEERRLEVYRAALEQAYESEQGEITPEEERLLGVLRNRLGITVRDHAVLDYAVRSALRGPRAPPEIAPGAELLGKYRVGEALGAGGFGETFLAEDTVLGRNVVIKVLRPGIASDDAALAEARRLARIRHPNVITLYDVERVGERLLLVTEHVEGGSMDTHLRRQLLSGDKFRRVALGLFDALQAVHEAGMVHRDVKPSNILLTRNGDPKLADFGIAALPDAEQTIGGPGGMPVGTVRYMSPEQAKGHRVTARSDLFSAAATLYEAYTGRPYLEPLPNESSVELQMRAAAARPFHRPLEGPEALRVWFARALAPDPADRFASAREAREALENGLVAAR